MAFQEQAEAVGQEAEEAKGELAAALANEGDQEDDEGAALSLAREIVQQQVSDRLDVQAGSDHVVVRDIEFDALLRVAESDATAAVLGAWRRVERALGSVNLPVTAEHEHLIVPRVLGIMEEQNMLPSDLVRSAYDLRQLRNRVAHGGEIYLTKEGAISYVEAARRVVDALMLANSPSALAYRYETSLLKYLREFIPSAAIVAESDDRRFDVVVRDTDGRSAFIVAKFYSRGTFDIVRFKKEAAKLSLQPKGAVVVVTNANLSDAVREHNSALGRDPSLPYIEVVQWRTERDSPELVRAVVRALR